MESDHRSEARIEISQLQATVSLFQNSGIPAFQFHTPGFGYTEFIRLAQYIFEDMAIIFNPRYRDEKKNIKKYDNDFVGKQHVNIRVTRQRTL